MWAFISIKVIYTHIFAYRVWGMNFLNFDYNNTCEQDTIHFEETKYL